MDEVIEGKDYSFPKAEEEILGLWHKLDAFKEQLRRTEGKPEYVFFDGPPFATGLPHYGHILAGTLKVAAQAAAAPSACTSISGRPLGRPGAGAAPGHAAACQRCSEAPATRCTRGARPDRPQQPWSCRTLSPATPPRRGTT
jgi:hypothetical protein